MPNMSAQARKAVSSSLAMRSVCTTNSLSERDLLPRRSESASASEGREQAWPNRPCRNGRACRVRAVTLCAHGVCPTGRTSWDCRQVTCSGLPATPVLKRRCATTSTRITAPLASGCPWRMAAQPSHRRLPLALFCKTIPKEPVNLPDLDDDVVGVECREGADPSLPYPLEDSRFAMADKDAELPGRDQLERPDLDGILDSVTAPAPRHARPLRGGACPPPDFGAVALGA